MPRYFEHALAIAAALGGVRNVEVVPDPPQTPMMHLHLRVDAKAFLATARRIAEERSIFTWSRTAAGGTPSIRVVELAVGDATVGFAPTRWRASSNSSCREGPEGSRDPERLDTSQQTPAGRRAGDARAIPLSRRGYRRRLTPPATTPRLQPFLPNRAS